jgi:hypothetical protein
VGRQSCFLFCIESPLEKILNMPSHLSCTPITPVACCADYSQVGNIEIAIHAALLVAFVLYMDWALFPGGNRANPAARITTTHDMAGSHNKVAKTSSREHLSRGIPRLHRVPPRCYPARHPDSAAGKR